MITPDYTDKKIREIFFLLREIRGINRGLRML